MPPGPEAITREQIDHASGVTGVVQNAKAVNLYSKQGVAIREFELKSGSETAEYLLCNNIDLTPRSYPFKVGSSGCGEEVRKHR